MNVNVKTVGVVVIAITAIIMATVYGLSSFMLHYPHEANIAAGAMIGVFLDEDCTLELANGTTIDWGTVSFGSNTKTYWIKNTGNCEVTVSLATSTMPSGWSLSWDDDGTAIAPAGTRKVIITLTVPTDESAGTYSWNSWITADEA